MLLATLKALPSWLRRAVVPSSFSLIGFVVAMLLALPAAQADELPALSLAEAVRLASEQSPQMAAQRSAITAAEQATMSARQLPDPKAIVGIDNGVAKGSAGVLWAASALFLEEGKRWLAGGEC